MSKKTRAKKPKHSVTVNGYTYRWDSTKDQEMNAIFDAWAERDWLAWLKEHLHFPFQAKRVDDDDDAYFKKGVAGQPFRLGSTMTIVGLSDMNDEVDLDFSGVTVDAKHGRRKDAVPLQDLEVVPPDDPNYGPVMEWVVHDANK